MRDVMEERVQASYQPETTGTLFAVGNVCMKTAGRDAGKLCVITEVVDKHYVKVDGHTRPRKVNVHHLEPTGKNVAVKKNSSSKDIQAMLQ
jgi:large subunit ribosomal protein L14e